MKTLKKSTELTDEDLVKAIVITGNTLFFELLYDRYADLVFYKCCCFSKNEDEAKHLAQDVFD